MKRKFKIFTLLLSAIIMFSACEEDERLYDEADIHDTSIATSVQISNIAELWAFSLDPEFVGTGYTYTKSLNVRVLGAVPTTDVNVAFSIIDTLFIDNDTIINTAVEGKHYTISNSSVITIPAGSNIGTATLTIYPDSVVLGTDETICWEITGGDLTLTELGLASTFTMFRNCPLDLNLFNGTFEMDNEGDIWTSTVKQDPVVPGRIWVYEVWTGSDSCYLDIDAEGVITAEDQFTMQDDFYGYGRVMFEDISGIVTDNCTPVFEFDATPTLPESGAWWGGEFNFKLTKISDKTDRDEGNIPDRGIPFKY